jgi:hypothetical protein
MMKENRRTLNGLCLAALGGAVALLTGACSSSSSPSGDAGHGADGASETSTPADAGHKSDAGQDASSHPDATRPVDASTHQDAPHPSDVWSGPDVVSSGGEGGNQTDASSGVDSSTFEDALLPFDAGRDGSLDAVPPTDAPASKDASPGTDASLVTLTLGLTSPYGIALDTANVYWTDVGADDVLRIAKTGGSAHWVATSQETPSEIQVNSTGAYWATTSLAASAVVRLKPDGGTPSSRIFDMYSSGDPLFAVDTTNVYYLNSECQLIAAPLSFEAPIVLATSAGRCGAATAIAVDAKHVYWSEAPLLNDAGSDIAEGPLVLMADIVSGDGGAPTVLDPIFWQEGPPLSIAVDAVNVYWAQAYAGVWMVPIKGGTATPLTEGELLGGASIATDGVNVYWTDQAAGTVMKVPVAGGKAATLASSQIPVAVAVDDTSVYWLNAPGGDAGTGSVMKLTPK